MTQESEPHYGCTAEHCVEDDSLTCVAFRAVESTPTQPVPSGLDEQALRSRLTPLRGFPTDDGNGRRRWTQDRQGAYLGFEDVIDALSTAPAAEEKGAER